MRGSSELEAQWCAAATGRETLMVPREGGLGPAGSCLEPSLCASGAGAGQRHLLRPPGGPGECPLAVTRAAGCPRLQSHPSCRVCPSFLRSLKTRPRPAFPRRSSSAACPWHTRAVPAAGRGPAAPPSSLQSRRASCAVFAFWAQNPARGRVLTGARADAGRPTLRLVPCRVEMGPPERASWRRGRRGVRTRTGTKQGLGLSPSGSRLLGD